MKTLHISLALLCVCCGCTFAAETRDLVLVAGQSNAVGYDAKPSDLPADPADKDILFWWRAGDPPPDEHDSTSGGKWTHLQPQPRGNPKPSSENRQYGNFAQTNGGFGPEIGFARTLHAVESNHLAIVKVAFSGTAMAMDWNPADPGDGGACYRALVAETKAAIAAAKTQGITLRLRALAWVQGESDANATAAPLYEKALGDMITELRKDLAAPQMIALLAVNTHFGSGKNPFMPQIIEAQQALGRTLPHCAYVDTATATIANSVHFDAAGTLDVGRRFAEALIKCEAPRDAKPLPGAAVTPAGVPVPTMTDVAYGSHPKQLLTFWKAKSDKPTPLLLFIHGGSWVGEDRMSGIDVGISVVSVEYRFISEAMKDGVTPPVKAPLHDVARALQFALSQFANRLSQCCHPIICHFPATWG